MKNLTRIFTILFGLTTTVANAQLSGEEIRKKFEAETIYHSSYYHYIKDGQKFRTGFTGRKMMKEFEISPEGKAVFQKYLTHRNRSLWLGAAGLAGLIGSSLLSDYDNPGNPNNNLAAASYGAGIVLSSFSIISSIKSQKNFDKAIWLRNRDVFAQEDIRRKYEAETIYHVNYNRYYKNDKKHKVGFLGNKMVSEFNSSPEAMAAFQQYRTLEKTGFILFGTGIASLIGSIFIIDFENSGSPRNFLAGSVYGAGLAMSSFSITYFIRGQRKFDKAIWLRNRDILVRQ